MSLFVEHHDGDTRNRLRHGVEAEDGVKFYGCGGGDVLHTAFFKMDEFALTGDQW